MTATLIASQRKTSNSRGPGQEGAVYIQPPLITACPKCAAAGRPTLRYGTGPHAPHWTERDGRQVLVDCAGDEVVRPPPERLPCSARNAAGVPCRFDAGHDGPHRPVLA